MAALPYMQLYVADYLADTAHLSAEENGAYLLLIFNYWQRGHALSNASERLANVARLSSERWAEIKPKLAEFFTIDGDTWTHDRIEADLAAVAAKSTKAKAAGASGGSKRQANAKQTLGERSTDAEQTSSHTDTDTDTDTEADIKATPVVPTGDAAALVSAYHDLLPKCKRAEVMSPKRKKRIAAVVKLARGVCASQGWPYEALNFWRAYFTECAKDPWMRGEVPNPNNANWRQHLDCLIAEDRFADVMDRAIESLRRAS